DLRAVAVLNAADAQGRDNADAAEALKEVAGIDFLPIAIGRRKAFPNAASSGHAVSEHIPKDMKALTELRELIKALYVELNDTGVIYNGNRKETQWQSFRNQSSDERKSR